MALPHQFKRIRLDLARSKEFPPAPPSTAMNSWPRSTTKAISTQLYGKRIATTAGCAGSGRAKTTRSAGSSISRAVKNTPAGCSIMIATGSTMTRQDTASERMFLPPASM